MQRVKVTLIKVSPRDDFVSEKRSGKISLYNNWGRGSSRRGSSSCCNYNNIVINNKKSKKKKEEEEEQQQQPEYQHKKQQQQQLQQERGVVITQPLSSSSPSSLSSRSFLFPRKQNDRDWSSNLSCCESPCTCEFENAQF